MNFWFSSALDLFGSEISSNAASYFANGLKGRPDEALYDDHQALGDYTLEMPQGTETVPMRNAMNEVMRVAYIRDCEIGVKRWNGIIKKGGIDFELRLPSARFRRTIGAWANIPTDPAGNPIPAEAFAAGISSWLPTPEDRAFVQSLMQPVYDAGKDRRLDRPARPRDQQPAGGLRVRARVKNVGRGFSPPLPGGGGLKPRPTFAAPRPSSRPPDKTPLPPAPTASHPPASRRSWSC